MAHFIDFQVGGWYVGDVEANSGIFIGQNLQYGWRGTSKINRLGARAVGDFNYVESIQSTVLDADILDTWIQKGPPMAEITPPSPALLRALEHRRRHYRRVAWED